MNMAEPQRWPWLMLGFYLWRRCVSVPFRSALLKAINTVKGIYMFWARTQVSRGQRKTPISCGLDVWRQAELVMAITSGRLDSPGNYVFLSPRLLPRKKSVRSRSWSRFTLQIHSHIIFYLQHQYTAKWINCITHSLCPSQQTQGLFFTYTCSFFINEWLHFHVNVNRFYS